MDRNDEDMGHGERATLGGKALLGMIVVMSPSWCLWSGSYAFKKV
jgi:hypothetical protein